MTPASRPRRRRFLPAVLVMALAPMLAGTPQDTADADADAVRTVDAEGTAAAFGLRGSLVMGFEPIDVFVGGRSKATVYTAPRPTAYGFASWYDFNLAEMALPDMPGRALCDTQVASTGDEGHATLSDGAVPLTDVGVHDGAFHATCTRSPEAGAITRIAAVDGPAALGILDVGAVDTSATVWMEPDGTLAATTHVELAGVDLVDEVTIGTVHIEVHVRTDGERVEVEVRQPVVDVRVAGSPLAFGPDGVDLPGTTVPLPLRDVLDPLADATPDHTLAPVQLEVQDQDPTDVRVVVVGPTLSHGPTGRLTLGGAEVRLRHHGAGIPPRGTSADPPVHVEDEVTGGARPAQQAEWDRGAVAADADAPPGDRMAPPTIAPDSVRVVTEEVEVLTRRSRWPALALVLAGAWLLREVVARQRGHPLLQPLTAGWSRFARTYLRG